MAVLQTGLAKSLAEDYTIDQSLRFNDDDDPILSRTPTVVGNRKTFTVSVWVKRGNLALTYPGIFSGGTGSNSDMMRFNSDDTFGYRANSSYEVKSTAVYRDPSAWYHTMMVVDTNESVAADRVKLYINGDQITDLATTDYPAEDFEGSINNTVIHYIGTGDPDSPTTRNWDGYLAEFYFIDGTAYDADDFGETDSTTNQWKPIDASGLTFGTNGFYQKYAGTELANSFFDSGNGGRHVVTANGDVHTDTAVKKIGTASAQFDGTGDYLSVPDSTDWNFTASEATIECWVYLNSMPSVSVQLIGQNDGSASNWFVYIYANGKIAVGLKNVNEVASATGVISTDTWYHVAVVRESSDSSAVTRIYVDGVSVANATAQYFNDSSDDLFIGGNSDESGLKYMDGYLDEIRISDVARYQIPFTPSTEAFTNDINTMLLLHCDGSNDGTSFPDSASHPITAVGDPINTRAQRKIGDSSIVLDGTTDYLTVAASSDFNFGSGAWTIEMWIRATGVSASHQALWSTDIASSTGWDGSGSGAISFGLEGANFYFDTVNAAGSGVQEKYTGFSFVADTWYNISLTNAGSTGDVKFWLNGTLEHTFETGGSVFGYSTNALGIGLMDKYSGTARLFFGGYLDEIRVSNTERYTSTFTPATTEFTTDSNTMLLIHSNWDGGLGADSSGNYNTFTATNLVATDKMVDSPTNNFATINPLVKPYGTNTFSEGNLKSVAGSGWQASISTISASSGKWYWETLAGGTNQHCYIIGTQTDLWFGGGQSPQDTTTGTIGYIGYDGSKRIDGTDTSYGDSFNTGAIIAVALDLDAGTPTVTFYKNNVSQGAITFTGNILNSSIFLPAFATLSQTTYYNFGADSSFSGEKTAQGNQDGNEIGDFYYEPPSGFLALCTSNLPDPEIKLPGDNFNTILYTGDDSSPRSLTGVGFQPDFTWGKDRSAGNDHWLTDAVRGTSEQGLASNQTYAEGSGDQQYGYVSGFGSDGFTLTTGTGGNISLVNNNTTTYVAWNWLGANGTVTNTDGTLTNTVTVSANPTAGFSIVKWSGTSSASTIGHGLTEAPALIIVKNTNTVLNWFCGAGDFLANGWSDWMHLNKTDEQGNNSANAWNSTAPTASVFSVDSHYSTNATGDDYIAYCFHSVEGYSKVGSFEGNNNNDGTFLYLGFRPAYVMVKSTTGTANWAIEDNKRNTYNQQALFLQADTNDDEFTNGYLDFLSNGIKFRNTNADFNDAQTYLYIAFADSPFKYANAR